MKLELIDLKIAIEAAKGKSEHTDVVFDKPTESEIVYMLRSLPIVDAAPVVHSRWVVPVPGYGFPYCENCKATALDKGLFMNPKLMEWYRTAYCPHCGARMDGKAE